MFFASAHLASRLLLLLQLQSENPAAFDRASVRCNQMMNGSFVVKMAAV